MIETHPFQSFIPKDIKYLLLGSFASKQLIRDKGYDWFYGTKRNQLWPIISKVYELSLESKEDRKKLFTSLGIGIADIIYQCERSNDNSSDNNLINIVYNSQLNDIVSTNNINTIFFTSRFVENLYKKAFKNLVTEFPEINLVTLPSPSPRYALLTMEQKVQRYKELLPSGLIYS